MKDLQSLTDIELNLELAKIAGLEVLFTNGTVLDVYDAKDCKRYKVDYLNDLNAFDDLCKKLGFTWHKGSEWDYKEWKSLALFKIICGGGIFEVLSRPGDHPKCRLFMRGSTSSSAGE